MGAETRIGIVTGLIIVVVASVYFFYGNESGEKDFLVSADAKVSVPPKIPATVDQKRTVVPSQPKPRAEKDPRAINMSPRTRRQLVLNNPGSRRAPGTPPARRTPRINRHPGMTPRTGGSPVTTTLRGTPGEELVKATQENLARHLAEAKKDGAKKPVEIPADENETTARPEATTPRVTPEQPRSARNPERPAVRPGDRPAARPAPRTPPQPRRHTVGAGETLSGIAQTYYGSCAKYPLILRANPDIRNPKAVPVGKVLVIPADVTEATQVAAAATAASDTRAGQQPRTTATPPARHRTYRVQKGDTFYAIAKKMLGNGARWQELYRLNQSLVRSDPKRLKPGMVIKLPE